MCEWRGTYVYRYRLVLGVAAGMMGTFRVQQTPEKDSFCVVRAWGSARKNHDRRYTCVTLLQFCYYIYYATVATLASARWFIICIMLSVYTTTLKYYNNCRPSTILHTLFYIIDRYASVCACVCACVKQLNYYHNCRLLFGAQEYERNPCSSVQGENLFRGFQTICTSDPTQPLLRPSVSVIRK